MDHDVRPDPCDQIGGSLVESDEVPVRVAGLHLLQAVVAYDVVAFRELLKVHLRIVPGSGFPSAFPFSVPAQMESPFLPDFGAAPARIGASVLPVQEALGVGSDDDSLLLLKLGLKLLYQPVLLTYFLLCLPVHRKKLLVCRSFLFLLGSLSERVFHTYYFTKKDINCLSNSCLFYRYFRAFS